MCGSVSKLVAERKYSKRCTNSKCRKQESFLKGTVFETSKLHPIKILKVLELWLEGASRNLISYIVDIPP